MMVLVIGASGSGKSQFAEDLAVRLKGERRFYIAAMKPEGEGAAERIARHRAQRAGKGFETIERFTDLAGLSLPAGSTVLLECMSNLAANEMFLPDGGGIQAVYNGIDSLRSSAEELIIVTNSVFSDGIDYDESTMEYIRMLGQINIRLAAMADAVVELVYSIPVFLKGDPQL